MKLHTKIFIGLVGGIVAGAIFGPLSKSIAPVGTLFLNLIRMIIIPLVFSSLVVGAANIGDIRSLGRIGGKTVVFYLVTTGLAVIIGLVLANLIGPGQGLTIDVEAAQVTAREAPSVASVILGLVPTNPFQAMIEGNMLQIIVLALFLGLGITMVGKTAQVVLDFFTAFAEVMYRLTGVIMELAPYGVFALIAPVVASYGPGVVLPLFKVILAVYLGCILHWLIVYSPLVRGLGKLNPWQFFREISPAQIYAFSTCSSSGTLPISMECARKLGIPNQISSFVLPLGATVNMDGTALYQGVCALFIAQVYGLSLGLAQQLMIVLTATLASIGTAGVPGAGLIMLSMVLAGVGLPLEGIALVAGIDRILDMIRTTTNITGDLVGAVIIAESEAERSIAESPSLPR
ncbi:MAG: dicarboxylate/amino acid:cation symporter [Firmicutes bacterium]|nr:dicarboxylate/amino acid:cation symporter [Bacillota bacterium]